MQGIVLALATLTGVCSLTGLLGSSHWFFDLFNHFRPQALVAGLTLLVFGVALRYRTGVVLACLILLLNGGLIATRLLTVQSQPQTVSDEPVSLISANLLSSNNDHQAVRAMIQREAPDIFVALEADHEWTDALRFADAQYPHQLSYPRLDNFGMAVLSKRPFQGRVIRVDPGSVPLFHLDFGSFVLIAAHPPPPLGRQGADSQKRYLREILYLAEATSKPMIIAGDLNTTLWADTMKPLISAGFSPANRTGMAWTWPTGFRPLGIQIDHILVRGAKSDRFRTLPYIGSDHFPIAARFAPRTMP
ncbi:endonuclease/exonuclease/phosphatase family protein [Iodidimonas sp. SYSU 1G8]|uniref:endonuclease/exonuclease/phosphatase family protein n=1 Tax=Iodidimonas sp. SYSU 1G8 TaxID=3133967 RepID=UPI0031FE712F